MWTLSIVSIPHNSWKDYPNVSSLTFSSMLKCGYETFHYRKISHSIEAMRFGPKGVWSLWNLTNVLATLWLKRFDDDLNHQYRGFETSRYLTVRLFIIYWSRPRKQPNAASLCSITLSSGLYHRLVDSVISDGTGHIQFRNLRRSISPERNLKLSDIHTSQTGLLIHWMISQHSKFARDSEFSGCMMFRITFLLYNLFPYIGCHHLLCLLEAECRILEFMLPIWLAFFVRNAK